MTSFNSRSSTVASGTAAPTAHCITEGWAAALTSVEAEAERHLAELAVILAEHHLAEEVVYLAEQAKHLPITTSIIFIVEVEPPVDLVIFLV